MYYSGNIRAPPPGAAAAPPLEEAYARLAAIEADLNACKDALETVSRIDHWLRMADTYAGLRRLMSARGHRNVNNAWLKGYEMFVGLGVQRLRAAGAPLTAFLNAELPGGFIGALATFARREGFELDWVASSLHPRSDEIALTDRYGLVAAHPDRWLMDGSLAGDLRDVNQVAELVGRVRARFAGGVDLYTSDAGYSVGGDYNRQEEILAQLNLGQIVAGLGALRAGGALVIKMFTCFSPFSVTLLVLLSESFEALRVVKPLASREANSEIYVVGEGYSGAADPQLVARLEDFGYGAFDVGAVADAPARGAMLLEIAEELFGGIQVRALRGVLKQQIVPPRVRRLREEAWLESVRMRDAPGGPGA